MLINYQNAIPKILLVSTLIIFTQCLLSTKVAVAQSSLFSRSVIVGKVGNSEITASQITSLVAAQNSEVKKSFAQQPEAIKNLVSTELVRRLLLNEALKVDWDKRTDVAVAMERGKEQAIIDNFVMSRSTPPEQFPSDAEIKTAYTENIARFQTLPQVRLAQILLRLPENSSAADIKRTLTLAQELSQKLDKGENFETLAKEYSQDETTKNNGGVLDWISESDLTQQFRTVIIGLKVNSVSKPIRSPFGYQLIRLVERKPSSTIPLSDVKQPIIKALRDTRTNQNRDIFLDSLRKANPLTIYDEALKEIKIQP
jgi:peptidylprolyl isomerase